MVGIRVLRISFLFMAFALAFGGAFEAQAGGRPDAPKPEALPASIPEAGAVFVDLLAADFYETDLRLAQSRRIEAETARRYLALDEAGRARFRAERRRLWQEMSETERDALRGAKRPRFANLDESQKQTFRKIAAEELGARPRSGVSRGEI